MDLNQGNLALVLSDSEVEQRQQEELENKVRKMKFDLLMGLTSKVNNFMNKDGHQYDQFGRLICSKGNCDGKCVDQYGNPLSCHKGSSGID